MQEVSSFLVLFAGAAEYSYLCWKKCRDAARGHPKLVILGHIQLYTVVIFGLTRLILFSMDQDIGVLNFLIENLYIFWYHMQFIFMT